MIIAFTGPHEAGKDSMCALLKLWHAEHLSFTQPIRNMMIAMGFPEGSVYGTHEEKMKSVELGTGIHITGRRMMVLIGELLRENSSPDLWARLLERRLRDSDAQHFVISDLRKREELHMLQPFIECGECVVIRLERPGKSDVSKINLQVLDAVQFTYVNDGDQGDLLMLALKIAKKHLLKEDS